MPKIEAISDACEGYHGKTALDFFSYTKFMGRKGTTGGCGHYYLWSNANSLLQSTQSHGHFPRHIDDFSRMNWVHFLKEKSETFLVFKIFKSL